MTQQNLPKKTKYFKILKRSVLVLLLLFVLIIAGSIILVYAYEKDIKRYTAEIINEQLNTNLSEDNFSLNALGNFPYASVEINGLKTDTISNENNIYAEVNSLSVFFHLPDLLIKHFTIKKIKLGAGKLIIRSDKQNSSGGNSLINKLFELKSDLSLDLNSAVFENFNIIIADKNKILNDLDIIKAELKARWQESHRQIVLNSKINFGLFFDENDFRVLNDIQTSVVLYFNEDESCYEVISGSVENKGIKIYMNNSRIEKEEVHLKLSSAKTHVKDLLVFIPDSVKRDIEKLKPDGNLMLNMDITSYYQAGANPYITGDFSFEDISISVEDLPEFRDINGTGRFSNGSHRNLSSSGIDFNEIRFRMGNSDFELEAGLHDLIRPEINIQARGELDLMDLQEYFTGLKEFNTEGIINLTFRYKRQRPGWGQFQLQDILYSKLFGKAVVSNMDFKTDIYPSDLTLMEGTAYFDNNNLSIDSLVIYNEESKIILDARIKELFSALLFEKNIKINSDIYSPFLNVRDFISTPKQDFSTSDSGNLKINWTGKLQVDSLVYDNFSATQILGIFNYFDDTLKCPSLQLKAFDGSLTARGNMVFSREGSVLNLIAGLHKTKIEELFYELNDLGQQSIRSENIRGELNADIIFKSKFNRKFKPFLSDIYATSDFEILNGRLIDFRPIVESLKILNEDSLSDMQFSTLRNQIEIKDQIIYIPKMNIRSNALNFEGYGNHSFNNEFDYHFRILLADFLSKKARDKKKKFEEYGYIEDDGYGKTALYFHLSGNLEDYNFRYDKKALKDKIIADFQREKKRIAGDFREEFKWLKRDSAKRAVRIKEKEFFREQEEGNFILEWDTEPDTISK